MEKVTSFEINIDSSPESIHLNLDDDTTVPIVVTDYVGFNFLKKNNIEFPGALTGIQFSEKDITRFKVDIGYIPLLNSRYEKLISEPDTESVILGSSYAYQGFPDKLLEKSVNLSIFSGDLTLTYSLIKNITKTTNTKNFIMCIGLYDIFYEFSMGDSVFFPLTRYFCKNQNIEYNFRNKLEHLNGQSNNHSSNDKGVESNKQYILGPLDLFVQHIYEEKFYYKFSNDEELSLLGNLLLDETTVKKSIDFINNRSYCTDFLYSSTDILTRVSALSKHYQRKHSFENNKEIMSSLIALLEETNSKINFIVMPFTKFYVESFEQNVKNETLSYIKSITNEKNVFMIDLSTHEAFSPEDFYDSDHLNFNGAKKLCTLVKQLGLEI